MNWRLLLYLSIFGFVMAIATISFIPQQFEPVLWLFILGFSAYSIAKGCNDRYFTHGFLLSIISCIYIVAFHTAFFDTYAASHESWVSMLPKGPNQRAASAAFGVVTGVISGLVQGAICVLMAKMMKKSQTV